MKPFRLQGECMAWKREEASDRSAGTGSAVRRPDLGQGAGGAQRRLEAIRGSVLLERERDLRAHALDAYESLDEASERLIAAIVRLVEARAAWSRLYQGAHEAAQRHAVAADRARVGTLAPPPPTPWPTETEYPAIWTLLQPDAAVEALDPARVKEELRNWAMGWYAKREQQRRRRLRSASLLEEAGDGRGDHSSDPGDSRPVEP